MTLFLNSDMNACDAPAEVDEMDFSDAVRESVPDPR